MKLKIVIGLLLANIIAVAAVAQQSVSITGSLKTKIKKPVNLFSVENGKLVELSNFTANDNGEFNFSFTPKYAGFYVMGIGGANSSVNNFAYYFKGGEKLAVDIFENSYELKGNTNSKENKLMYGWVKLKDSLGNEQKPNGIKSAGTSFENILPNLENLRKLSATFVKKNSTGNASFEKLMKEFIHLDIGFLYQSNYLKVPASVTLTKEDLATYFTVLNSDNFSKSATALYSQPWGFRVLYTVIKANHKYRNIKSSTFNEALKTKLDFVANDTLKGDIVLELSTQLKTYNDYTALMETYGKYMLTQNQQQENSERAERFNSLRIGEASYQFSFPDKDGKIVSMADLKGKVVLIDVWATWCAPCVAEIPHLKKLEEEMAGKDFQVVSISVDDKKLKGKWAKMITDKQMGGIQLFAPGENDFKNGYDLATLPFCKFYDIKNIPRFMLFDRQGKIITTSSPRPSQPELKKMIEEALLQSGSK